MRHKLKGRKLNKTSSHRQAMMANMAVSLVINEQIQTTLPKAKELRPYVEKLITKAKNSSLSTRRLIISKIKDEVATTKLITVLGERYKDRHGGYTRIIKSGFRYGDMAPLAYIELLDRDVTEKGKKTVSEAKDNNSKLGSDVSQ